MSILPFRLSSPALARSVALRKIGSPLRYKKKDRSQTVVPNGEEAHPAGTDEAAAALGRFVVHRAEADYYNRNDFLHLQVHFDLWADCAHADVIYANLEDGPFQVLEIFDAKEDELFYVCIRTAKRNLMLEAGSIEAARISGYHILR